MAKVTHYRDTVTGRYVTQSTWRRSKARGGTRYKRTYERYVKPSAPSFVPKPFPLGESVERLKYVSATQRVDLEISRYNGKLVSVSVAKSGGPYRTYKNKGDIAKLAAVIHAARQQKKN